MMRHRERERVQEERRKGNIQRMMGETGTAETMAAE